MSTMTPKHPEPPIYAVIFTNQRTEKDEEGYQKMADAMVALGEQQAGFLGLESLRNPNGYGITVSYWRSLEDIKNWKAVAAHKKAQDKGQSTWYDSYTTRIVEVDRIYGFLE